MELKGKNVLVIGTGISGMGAAKLLCEVGACPVLYEGNEKIQTEEIRAKLPPQVQAEIVTGRMPDPVMWEIALVVPSPGVPADSPMLYAYREAGIPVWGEVELAYRFSRGKIAAITGTNGKTTTTALVGHILKNYYSSVFVVGNIGYPYTQAALLTQEDSVIAAELSSFQLETTIDFKPQVSAILNITPDHLDRHYSMEHYAQIKEKIALNQGQKEACVLNYENEYTRKFGEVCPARVIYFSSKRKLERGIYLSGEDIYLADNLGIEKFMGIHEMHLVGICNVENVMAAIAIALEMKVPMEQILSSIKSFKAVEHRIEFVAEKKGVDYYNDSKGTNPDAAIQGIRAMSKPTVLLAGGYDKQSEYDEWIKSFEDKVKYLVLIGQTADKIEDCARKHGFQNILRGESFEEALKLCTQKAQTGDAVLLSPACASWGMFPNYEVRGNMFKDYVNSLEE